MRFGLLRSYQTIVESRMVTCGGNIFSVKGHFRPLELDGRFPLLFCFLRCLPARMHRSLRNGFLLHRILQPATFITSTCIVWTGPPFRFRIPTMSVALTTTDSTTFRIPACIAILSLQVLRLYAEFLLPDLLSSTLAAAISFWRDVKILDI